MNDYYLRLRQEQLEKLRLHHLVSEVNASSDEALDAYRTEAARAAAAITGYTEWASQAQPAHSVGWDWTLGGDGVTLHINDHSLRTNIMLMNADGVDLGRQQTLQALLHLVSVCDWESQVLGAIQFVPQAEEGSFPKLRTG